MAIGAQERRQERRPRVAAAVGESATDAALDLLELLDLAWHDCYGEIAPPEAVIDDVLVLARGELGRLVSAAKLAVIDRRDLSLAADALRAGR